MMNYRTLFIVMLVVIMGNVMACETRAIEKQVVTEPSRPNITFNLNVTVVNVLHETIMAPFDTEEGQPQVDPPPANNDVGGLGGVIDKCFWGSSQDSRSIQLFQAAQEAVLSFK